MKIAIVEDETLASTYLKSLLEAQSILGISQINLLKSVKESLAFFQQNSVDLIFMDIHLGDGKSLEIFEQVAINTPVVFITAYDNYAIQVFKQFTIDYILKPFEASDLHRALKKFKSIHRQFDIGPTLDSLVLVDQQPTTALKNRFMVHNGHKLKTVHTHEVAYFLASGKHLFLYTADGNSYIYNDTIKDIIYKLDPQHFFKINRKFVVHINSVEELIKHHSQKIEVVLHPHPENESPILVSKSQINELKQWLNR